MNKLLILTLITFINAAPDSGLENQTTDDDVQIKRSKKESASTGGLKLKSTQIPSMNKEPIKIVALNEDSLDAEQKQQLESIIKSSSEKPLNPDALQEDPQEDTSFQELNESLNEDIMEEPKAAHKKHGDGPSLGMSDPSSGGPSGMSGPPGAGPPGAGPMGGPPGMGDPMGGGPSEGAMGDPMGGGPSEGAMGDLMGGGPPGMGPMGGPPGSGPMGGPPRGMGDPMGGSPGMDELMGGKSKDSNGPGMDEPTTSQLGPSDALGDFGRSSSSSSTPTSVPSSSSEPKPTKKSRKNKDEGKKAESDARALETSTESCSPDGKMECAKDGMKFKTCDHGRWVFNAVAPGTKCRPYNGSILMDYP